MRTILLSMLIVLALSGCYKPKSTGVPLGSPDNPIVMEFVPSVEAAKVMTSAGLLASMIQERSELSIHYNMASNYVGVVEAMAAKKVQVAWLPPMAYVFAHDRNGDEAVLKVVRHGSPFYRGQIVVKADNPIKSVKEMKSYRIAFADQASASGYLYPKALLLANGIDPERDCQITFAGSHDAALTALLKGTADAACSFDDARTQLQAAFPNIMTQTRVLATTEDIPADCVAFTAGLDKGVAKKLTDALIAIASDEKGKQVLFELYAIEGLVPATDADYEPVRKMAKQLNLDVAEEVKKQ